MNDTDFCHLMEAAIRCDRQYLNTSRLIVIGLVDIGNAHLKWAFSEAAVLYLRGNEKAKHYLKNLQKPMSKSKALSVLAHKLGVRCITCYIQEGCLL